MSVARNFLSLILRLGLPISIGKIADGLGGVWDGSFVFISITLIIIDVLFRIRKYNFREFYIDLLYFPFIIFWFFSLWHWIRIGDLFFIITGGVAIYIWLELLRARIEINDGRSN